MGRHFRRHHQGRLHQEVQKEFRLRWKSIFELLKLANIPTGHCIQCGLPGHRLRQDASAMKDKKLADRSCLRCHQGLHSQDDCTKPVAAVSQVQVQDDPLNAE